MFSKSEMKDAFDCAEIIEDEKFDLLNDWEQSFINNCILQYKKTEYLSIDKQVSKINEIYDKYITRKSIDF